MSTISNSNYGDFSKVKTRKLQLNGNDTKPIELKQNGSTLMSVDNSGNITCGQMTCSSLGCSTMNMSGATVSDQLIVDSTNTSAFKVRHDSAGSDVFTIDTTNNTAVLNGDLTINGVITSVEANSLLTEDVIIQMAKNNALISDTYDQGFFGEYKNSTTKYWSLYRDASDSGIFKLQKEISTLPTTVIPNGTDATLQLGGLKIAGLTLTDLQYLTPINQSLMKSDLVNFAEMRITRQASYKTSTLGLGTNESKSDGMLLRTDWNAQNISDFGIYNNYANVGNPLPILYMNSSSLVSINTESNPNSRNLYVNGTFEASGNIYGTLGTASQPNITTLAGLSSVYGYSFTNISWMYLSLINQSVSTTGTPTFTGMYGEVKTATQNSIQALGALNSIQGISIPYASWTPLSTMNQAVATTSSPTFVNVTASLTGHASLDLALSGGTMSGAIAMGSNNISGIATASGTTASFTTLTGTLSTAAQTNITSLGTLTSLTTSGAINMANNQALTFKGSTGNLSKNIYTDGSNNLVFSYYNTSGTYLGDALTISSTGSILGTLGTASQSNITTLAGLTSFGATSYTTTTCNSNLSFGTNYRNLTMFGGNSYGYLYGSFPKWGDGIHIGYNYYADATGTNQIQVVGGYTSRLSVGYSSFVLGLSNAANRAPNDLGLYLDVNMTLGLSQISTSNTRAAIQLGQNGINGAGGWQIGQSLGSNTTKDFYIYDTNVSANRFSIDVNGSTVIGTQSALSTSATDGFIYIPTCAGAPTGVPTSKTGKCAMVYDTTNNKLYVYNGAWKGAVHS